MKMSRFMTLIRQTFGGAPAKSAGSVAKDRLSLMLVTQRSSAFLSSVDMDAFQAEVAEVVKKYMKIANKKSPTISGKRAMTELNLLIASLSKRIN